MFLKSVHFIAIFLVVLWREINKALGRVVFRRMESSQFELLIRKRTMNANLLFSIFNKTYAEHTALSSSLYFQKPEKPRAVFLKIKVPRTRQHKIFNYTMYFNVTLLLYKTKEQWKVSDGLCSFLFRDGGWGGWERKWRSPTLICNNQLSYFTGVSCAYGRERKKKLINHITNSQMFLHREPTRSTDQSLSLAGWLAGCASQPPGEVELRGREGGAVRRLKVLHVLPSLAVERTRWETEEALRQKGVGGG